MTHIKKIISAVLVAAMAALLLCSCGNNNSEVPSGMKLLDSDFVNYKFYIPEDWIPDISTGILTAKTNDNSNVSMQTMAPSGSYKNADEYFRTDYYAKVQSTFKNTALIEEECSTENQRFGKQQIGCVKYVYTVESDGVTYKILQYFTLNGGYLYIFTYTAAESVFSEHLEEVSSMVQNFVF